MNSRYSGWLAGPAARWAAAALPLLLTACTSLPPAGLAHGAGPYRPAALVPPGLAGPGAARPHAAPVPADTSAAGLAPILADLRRRSYFLSQAAGAAPRQVRNRAQRLRATLAPASYTVAAAVPMPPKARPGQPQPAAPVAGKPAWQVRLALRGIGRGGRVAFGPAAVPTLAAATDTSVRYQHGAAFAVEYTNTPAGVRQNYYLAQRPAGPAGPVRVELTLATKLRATWQADGQALTLAPAEGGAAVLRYGGLRAWDATGRALPSRLRLSGATALALEVDDAGAAYPLTIDPLLTTPVNRLDDPASGNYDDFSASLAGAGDVNGDGYADVIISAEGMGNGGGSRGSAYLYFGSATGLGTPAGTAAGTVQRLDDPNNQDNDLFSGSLSGGGVSGAGDVNGDGYGDVLVGAEGTANGGSNRGSAYLFLGSATGLGTASGTTAGTMQRFDDPNAADNDLFGASVAGAGDVNGDGYADVLVGAYNTANGGSSRGSTYLYLGSATGLGAAAGTTAGTMQRLNDPNTTNPDGDRFGFSVAGAGDVNADGYADVVVGAYRTTNSRGSAYLFLGSATGLGTASGTTAGKYQRFNDPVGVSGDSFGVNVAGAGDVNGDGYADVIIGAYGTSTSRGTSYLYLGSAASLGATAGTTAGKYQRLNNPNATSYDGFGSSVAGAGDVNGDGYADVLIGAYGIANGGSYRGSAYLFLGSATGLGTTAGLTAGKYQRLNNPNNMDGDQFGSSVAGAGDVNGDGYADVLVGANQTNNSGTQQGSAYFYTGSPGPLLTSPSLSLNDPNNADSDNFGFSVAGAGDVNGDGYADVVIGAQQTNNGGRFRGSMYLYLGSATGLGTAAGTTPGTYQRFDDPAATDSDIFGWSVAGAGDVNGDGYGDVLVGGLAKPNGGSAYLYLGSAAGLGSTAGTTAGTVQYLGNPSNTTGENFGWTVAGAGDVNGDGYADVLIGASQAGNGGTNRGSAYLFLGSATSLGTAAGTTAGTYQRLDNPNNADSDYFGRSVAGAGDVNGDGYADVLVGAYGTANGGTTRGSAYLFLGSATGLGTAAGTTAGTYQRLDDPNNANGDYFGWSVAGTGDVNGDGYADVLVGAYQTSNGGTYRGSAYLYLGSAGGLGTGPGTTAGTVQRFDSPNNGNFDYFGASVAGAGDVNGDGYADVVIGAYQTGNGGTARGSAYLFLGSATSLSPTAGTTAGTYQRLNTPTNANFDDFGASVAGAGDVNGDGYADVLIGAYGTANGGTGRGSSYLYRGNQGDARPGGRLRVLNADLSAPFQAAANKPLFQFGLGLSTRSVQGRVRARLVWEVARNGQPFSAGSTLTTSAQYTGAGPWTDMPVGGTEFRQLIAKSGKLSYVRARLEYASASPLLAGSSTPANGTGGVGGAARYGPWQYVVAQQLATLNATPLPVVLTRFTATAEGRAAVRLTWATASEVNSARFEVERSLDGKAYTPVGQVAAAGRSSAPRTYELTDATLPAGAGVRYYRLRQVDQDGTATYSPVRTVALAGAGLSVYPNPATHGAATLLGAQPGAVVTVLDALGRPVATATADASGTATLGGLTPGLYLVRAGTATARLAVE